MDSFKTGYDQDIPNDGELRVCPKIVASHLTLNNLAKMSQVGCTVHRYPHCCN